jgi:hypothetical protein
VLVDNRIVESGIQKEIRLLILLAAYIFLGRDVQNAAASYDMYALCYGGHVCTLRTTVCAVKDGAWRTEQAGETGRGC